jgi:hypothetical protein
MALSSMTCSDDFLEHLHESSLRLRRYGSTQRPQKRCLLPPPYRPPHACPPPCWCPSIRQHTSAYVSIRQHTCVTCTLLVPQHTSAHANVRQHPSASISIHQHTSAYVSIRSCPPPCCAPCMPRTSAYVSIRQHTSAYASIRQHTSAYASIPVQRGHLEYAYIISKTCCVFDFIRSVHCLYRGK